MARSYSGETQSPPVKQSPQTELLQAEAYPGTCAAAPRPAAGRLLSPDTQSKSPHRRRSRRPGPPTSETGRRCGFPPGPGTKTDMSTRRWRSGSAVLSGRRTDTSPMSDRVLHKALRALRATLSNVWSPVSRLSEANSRMKVPTPAVQVTEVSVGLTPFRRFTVP